MLIYDWSKPTYAARRHKRYISWNSFTSRSSDCPIKYGRPENADIKKIPETHHMNISNSTRESEMVSMNRKCFNQSKYCWCVSRTTGHPVPHTTTSRANRVKLCCERDFSPTCIVRVLGCSRCVKEGNLLHCQVWKYIKWQIIEQVIQETAIMEYPFHF